MSSMPSAPSWGWRKPGRTNLLLWSRSTKLWAAVGNNSSSETDKQLVSDVVTAALSDEAMREVVLFVRSFKNESVAVFFCLTSVYLSSCLLRALHGELGFPLLRTGSLRFPMRPPE